jgi:hypothetical protein
MPAIVRWPGVIAPGTETAELAATYDIFTTMLTMAAVPLPSDRIIDGKDLTPILLGTGPSAHECIFNYHSGLSLAVVRCGGYKMHFDQEALPLFDLIRDPAEAHPLPYASNATLQAIADRISRARAAHLTTVVKVVDQIQLGFDTDLMLCGDPHSQQHFPQFPNCTSSPQNWRAPWPTPPPPPPVLPAAYVGCFWDKGYATGKGGQPCELPIVKAGNCPPKQQGGHDAGDGSDNGGGGVWTDTTGGRRVGSLAECQSLCAADASHPTCEPLLHAMAHGGCLQIRLLCCCCCWLTLLLHVLSYWYLAQTLECNSEVPVASVATRSTWRTSMGRPKIVPWCAAVTQSIPRTPACALPVVALAATVSTRLAILHSLYFINKLAADKTCTPIFIIY